MILLTGGPPTYGAFFLIICVMASPILAIISILCSYFFDTFFSKKQQWYKEGITGLIKFFYWILMFIVFYFVFAGIIFGFLIIQSS
jgi:anaerobic C4-dicarboxylate transporter